MASRVLSNVADFPVATLIEYVKQLNVVTLISQIFVDEALRDEGELDLPCNPSLTNACGA